VDIEKGAVDAQGGDGYWNQVVNGANELNKVDEQRSRSYGVLSAEQVGELFSVRERIYEELEAAGHEVPVRMIENMISGIKERDANKISEFVNMHRNGGDKGVRDLSRVYFRIVNAWEMHAEL
jgi:hypothetical protein